MKIEDKKKAIMDDIGKNLPIFNQQAHTKLIKRKEFLNTSTDYEELVSDVTFSIMNKLDKEEYVKKFYDMVKKDKLKNYILKGIDRNCTSFKAPFLQSKIKNKLLVSIDDDDVRMTLPDDDVKEDYPELTDEQEIRVKAIYRMCEPRNASKLFGTHWKYFVNLLKEYIADNSTTYKSLGLKYGVPVSSIGSHIQLIKSIIKQNIDNYINIIE